MASIEDVLMSLFQGAGVPAQEAAAKVAEYTPLVAKAGMGALGPLGSLVGNAAVGAGTALNAIPAEAGPLGAVGQLSSAAAPSPMPPSNAPALPPTPPPDSGDSDDSSDSTAPATPMSSPMAPTMPSTAPSVPAVASKPITPSSTPIASSDQATRQAQLNAANQKARLAAIPAAIAGIGGAIGGAASAFGAKAPEGAEEDILNRAQQNLATNKAAIEQGISNDPNSEASQAARSLVLQIAPQMANQPGFDQMTDQELRDKLPLVDTMMKAKAAEDSKQLTLKQLQATKDLTLGEKNSQFEDRQVNQGMGRVAGIRGDASLARTEMQRDAAITAYNRLDQIQKSGQPLNPVDYVDTLGQIYQARTGRAPGEQVLKDIRQYTAEGALGKAYTAVTGQQAPATSPAIAASLKNMALSMGQQADKMHEAYMAPHLVKPAGVSDAAWAPVLAQGRGMSFADATKSAAPTSSGSTADPLGIR